MKNKKEETYNQTEILRRAAAQMEAMIKEKKLDPDLETLIGKLLIAVSMLNEKFKELCLLVDDALSGMASEMNEGRTKQNEKENKTPLRSRS